MKSYTIYLIRNGLTAENAEGRYIGHTDVHLSEEGRAQLGQLADDMVFPYVSAVFSSPLARCTETANILYPGIKPIIIDDFIECNFGEFEGRTAEELKDSEEFAAWLGGEPDCAPPYGESNKQFFQRVVSAFESVVDGLLKTSTTDAAIVTHGGMIMAVLAAFGFPELPMHEWRCNCGCGFAIRIDARLWMTGRKFEVFSEFPYERETMPED